MAAFHMHIISFTPCSSSLAAGNDVEAAAERWTEARGPDARALADIEASFYKLVGGRRLGFLDPGFLRLIAHIALGAQSPVKTAVDR